MVIVTKIPRLIRMDQLTTPRAPSKPALHNLSKLPTQLAMSPPITALSGLPCGRFRTRGGKR